ncbi:MAG: pyridoxal phosphate-dependent decarboxylase family protein [Gemmatirosa sp.]
MNPTHPSSRDPVDLGAVFLGPKGENADVFERLLLEAFRDHVFWRRNFHPEDGFLVQERDKRTPAYEDAIATLSQELMGLLAELKAGVPFYSPRYIGHMTADLTMAGLVGYFATMLYNPNNVAAEGSPVTTRLELEVAAQLAAMIGYDPARQWGHLCSGGTVANLEALWVARNVKYLPVALRWAAAELGDDLPGGAPRVRLPGGDLAPLDALDLWQLLNVRNDDALDALDALLAPPGASRDAAWTERAWQALRRHGLTGQGAQSFGLRLAREFGDALPPGVVLAPSTAHYSWAKGCRVLGIGETQLVHVPVDAHFRMDPAALEEILHGLAARCQPVIAAVSVLGTTEESAVDRLDLVLDARDRAGRELGLAFHVHADAAWGGYAASITRGPDGARRSYADTLADYAPGADPRRPGDAWPTEALYRALCALERTDSVTIDPHKLGFVPYPAGAVSFRDGRTRHLVAAEAPYLSHAGASEWGFLGRYILEGSKPGAAAASVWLSHKVLPLDARGYGRLVGDTVRSAMALHDHLSAEDWGPFTVRMLPAPDLNIVCFAIAHAALTTLEAVNAFVGRVYHALSATADGAARPRDYFVTKTTLQVAEYGHAADALVTRLGFTRADYERAGGLAVLRCTVMDPFMVTRPGRTDFVGGFAAVLRDVLHAELAA